MLNFIGLGFLVYAAVSVAANWVVGRLTRPKQANPQASIPGEAYGQPIREGFNDFIVEQGMWVEPGIHQTGSTPQVINVPLFTFELDAERGFDVREKDGQKVLYLLWAIAVLGQAQGGAKLKRLWVDGNIRVNFMADEDEINAGSDPNNSATQTVLAKSAEYYADHLDYNEGLATQAPMAKWQAAFGLTNNIAYKSLITLGIDELETPTFPQIKGLLRTNTVYNVGGVLEKKALDAGIPQGLIDVAECTDAFRGYWIDPNGNSILQQVEDLMQAFFIAPVETLDGVLSFRKIARPQPILDIPLEDLGARPEGSSIDYLISRQVKDIKTMPREVVMTYWSQHDDYSKTSIRSDPHPRAVSPRVENIDLNILLVEGEAKIIANQLLYQIWQRFTVYKFTLPFRYKELLIPLDVVTINGTKTVQIAKMLKKANFTVEVEAFEYDTEALNYAASGANAIPSPATNTNVPPQNTIPTNEQNIIDNAVLNILDIPVHGTTDHELGIYLIANTAMTVYLSFDDGATYNESVTVDNIAAYGTCNNVLGSANIDNTNLEAANLPFLDLDNSLTITLDHGEFLGFSDYDFQYGEALFFVGSKVAGRWEGEFIKPKETIVNGNQLQFFDLRRGLRGTEYFIDKHVAGESIFLIDGATETYPIPENKIGETVYYKEQVLPSQALSSITAKAFDFEGQSIESYPPTDLSFTEDNTGLITFTLNARARPGGFLGEQDQHELDLLDASGNVVRTLSGNLEYSVADQNTDGLIAPFDVDAYRINSIVYRGHPSYFRGVVLGSNIPYVPLTNSIFPGVKTISSNYTLLEEDKELLLKFDTSGGAIELRLPDNLSIGFYSTAINIDINNVDIVDDVTGLAIPAIASPLVQHNTYKLFFDGDWILLND